MAWPRLADIIRTRLVFSLQSLLSRGATIGEAQAWLRRKYPTMHWHTAHAFVGRVARAIEAAQAMQHLPGQETIRRSGIPHFDGWTSREPGWEGMPFHYQVVGEVRLPHGRKSYFRTFELSSETVLSRDEIFETIERLMASALVERMSGSPPQGKRWGRLVGIEVKMVWRS